MKTQTESTDVHRSSLQCLAGLYIIQCDKVADSFKIGWTRDIDRRIWHSTYDPFGRCKRYAYALLFRFRDTRSLVPPNTYRNAELDELSWIAHLEEAVLADTVTFRDPLMGTEWRTGMPVDDAVAHVRDIVDVMVELLPEDIRPDIVQKYDFLPPPPMSLPPTRDEQDHDPLKKRPPTEEQHAMVEKAYRTFVQCAPSSCAMQLRWMCGMGKTWFALLLFHKLVTCKNATTCVIAVPSLTLVRQWVPDVLLMFRAWYACSTDVPLLVVGSQCHGGGEGDDGDGTDIERTTDRRHIRAFCERAKTTTCDKPAVVITTYHSAHLLEDATRVLDFRFGLLVCDEAHHLTGVTSTEKTRQFLRTHDVAHQCKLSLTATPKMYQLHESVHTRDKAVYSMDDVERFGDVLDTKTLDWAITHHKVSDYRVCVIRKTLNAAVQWLAQLDAAPLSNTTPSVSTAKHLGLAYASYIAADLLLRGTNKKLLLYANKTAHADVACQFIQRFIELIRQRHPDDVHHEEVHVCSLHSSTASPDATAATAGERRRAEELKFEKASYGVICCVQIYAEGVNMPFLDGVVFGEPMHSEIRIVQSALRSNRNDPNNKSKVASIVIPVLMADDGHHQEGANAFVGEDTEWVDEDTRNTSAQWCKQASNFDTVRKVLTHLSQHDAQITTRVVVKTSPMPDEPEPPDTETEAANEMSHRRAVQELHNAELNAMVKDLVYKFLNRGDLVNWTAPHLVTRVKALSARYDHSVYNEETYETLRERVEAEEVSTELPKQSPAAMFASHEFAWELVDRARASYYETAQACKKAVEQLNDDEFAQLCEDEGIEPTARTTLTRVGCLYHEMDPRVPNGLSERYYLRPQDSAPPEYVVEGVMG